MSLRLLAASFGIASVLVFAGNAWAEDNPGSAKAEPKAGKSADAPASKENRDTDPSQTKTDAETSASKAETPGLKTEKATFGGGCFWCQEAVFERIHGVKSVVSGYAGGTVAFPTYEMVHTGLTGHAEVIQIEYDPAIVTYDKLLSVFWASHDPTQLNMQGDDFGTQYRSIILYSNDAQKQAAQKSYQQLKARHVYRSPIVTQLVPLTEFYPAELYHQDYYRNNRYSDYSLSHIVPKLRKVKVK